MLWSVWSGSVQQCCTRACALVRFSILPNMWQHVATGWPNVRWKCTNLIKNMALTDIVGKMGFGNLDRDSLESVFRQRTVRLETFLKGIYPQVIGLAEFCILLCLKHSNSRITRCPQHFSSDDKATEGLIERIKSCPVCRNMIIKAVSFLFKVLNNNNNNKLCNWLLFVSVFWWKQAE